MLCNILKMKRRFSFFIFSQFLVLLGLLGFSSNCFAIEPVTVNITSGETYSDALILNCDSYYSTSSNPKYLIINSNSNPDLFSTNSNYYLRFWLSFNTSSTDYRIQPYFGYQIFDLTGWNIGQTTGSSPSGSCLSFYSSFTARDSFSITLTDTLPGSGSSPSGTLDITENGTFDVSSYEFANVNVPNSGSSDEAPYRQDLDAIRKAILIIPAVLLVLYFFYCIYRVIIRNGGSS